MEAKHVTRFERKVDRSSGPNACHPWTARRDKDGYGQFKLNGATVRANIVALEVKLGRPITPGMKACHTCDNKPCCNMDHLYEGTTKQNARDAVERGKVATGTRHGRSTKPECTARGDAHGSRLHPERRPRGTANKSAKITENDVRAIRELYTRGKKQVDIAKQFNVRQTTVSMIVRRETWEHVA